MMIPWMRMAPAAAPPPAAAQGPDPGCRDCKGTGEVVLLNRIARCLCLDRPRGPAPTAGAEPGRDDREGGCWPSI